MKALGFYTITATLYEEGSIGLYRGVHQRDGTPAIIKTSRAEFPGPREVERLHHEYEITRQLESPCLLKPYELEKQKAQLWLILEDFDGEPLSGQLDRPLETGQFLEFAQQLATALADIHRQDIVHKDLKPTNILFDPQTGAIKLTGFGIATRLMHVSTVPTNVSLIEGSLAYMSPEQTGRMNRGIDHRSDLYSLGVIFYELLTGELPFQAVDPLEWVHSHIARSPKPPTEIVPTIPEPLAAIVLKLLAKQAEDRYQTTGGLKVDLERCAAEWQAHKSIAPFQLGTRDIPGQLLIPKKLYGRQQEIGTLLAAFNRVVASGKPELVLVSGYSGIGKSAVVNELHKALVPSHGLFVGGKFDQYKRDIPYATLAQALQALVRQVLSKSEDEIAEWREDLQKAVGPNGRLVTNLIPDLVALIGEQPPVQDVPPQDAQNRFNTVFRRLLNVFARPEHPLALFLDDLQWLDAATLQLIEHLLIHPTVEHILLLGAYRDNEVGPSHPLVLALDSMRKGEATVQSIVLGPLMKEDVLRFTADAFHCEAERAEPLAQLVYEKTGGNPFFTIQFLIALADDGLVAFDGREACWQWDLDRIHDQGFTDNVADLMVGKLSRLRAETQDGLQQLACLGSEARLSTLAQVQEIEEEEVEKNLREAIQAGFLLRQEDNVSFLHDRVQEAAYALIPEHERPEIHLNIGRKLLSRMRPDELNDTLFDVVNHLNRGAALMTNPAEKAQLAELNVAAGKRARASIAYETARDFFAVAASLLPEDAWNTRYDFQFTLFLDWAQAEYLHGAIEEAERLFAILLAQAKSDLDRVKVYDLQLTVYPIAGKYDDAVAMAIKALQLLGVDIPEDDEALNLAIEAEAAEVKEKLKGCKIPELAEAPEATDPRVKAVIGILIRMGGPTYIGSRPQLYPLTPLKALNYSLKYGATKETGSAFSGYAFIMASVFGDPHAGYAFSELAVKLGHRFKNLNTISTALYIHGNHVNFWLKPIDTDFPILEQGFRACLDGGDLVNASYIAYSIVWQAVERGDTLSDALDFSRKYASFALGSRNEAIHQTIVLEQQFLKCLIGETDGNISFSDEDVSELTCVEKIAKASFTCGITYYHTMKTLAAYLMGDDAASQTHAEEAWKILAAVLAQPMEATFYFLHALVLTRTCRKVAEDEREKILRTLAEYQKKLAFWAENCPANFASKHALVSAEIAEIEGDELSAERLFEQAVAAARANGFIHWEAIASEAAARFHGSRGLKTISRAYLSEARDCYARWGANAKVKQLDALQPWLEEEASVEHGTIATRPEQLDVMSIVKAQHAISGEISLNRLAQTLLRIVMESAGAQRGYLLLAEGESLAIHAQAEIIGEETQVEVIPALLLSATTLPLSILNYVRRTGEAVVLADAAVEGRYVADEYMTRHKPRSVLCMAIQRQEKLLAVLYLENNLIARVFTPERCFILEILAAQAAISLEISTVYEALQESEDRLLSTLDAATIVAWEVNLVTGKLHEAGPVGKLFGRGEDFGHPRIEDLADSIQPDDRDSVVDKIARALRGECDYNVEFRVPLADGTVRWVASNGTLQYDAEGKPVRLLGVARDITAQKQAEEELARHRDHLEELVQARTTQLEVANKELESFSYSVSHDLRAPLRHIDGFLKLLQEKTTTKLDVQSQRYMANISDAARRMGILIDDLLSFSRMGRQEMSKAQVDLGNLVWEVIGELEPEAEDRNINWQIGDFPMVIGDRAMLKIVLDNLITNALKFTRTRQEVEIEIGCILDSDAEVTIFVQDNGVGFDMDYADKLFGVFQRLHSDDEFEGTGIGLANVRRIIDRHGGRTWAEGKVGGGATFYFSVPRSDKGE